jgi:hypothetical protein
MAETRCARLWSEARTGTKEAEGFEASERFHRLLAFSQSFAPAIFKAELFRVFKGDEK